MSTGCGCQENTPRNHLSDQGTLRYFSLTVDSYQRDEFCLMLRHAASAVTWWISVVQSETLTCHFLFVGGTEGIPLL